MRFALPVRKIILSIIIILALPMGFCLIYGVLSSGLLKGPYAFCRASISSTTEIKIVALQTDDRSGYFTYMITRDGGQTWADFMYFKQEDAFKPKCQNVKMLNEKDFWVWIGWTGSITHDGGQTWINWKDLNCCNNRSIEDVQFKDSLSGTMLLKSTDDETTILTTNDGGKTWHE